MQLGVQPGCLEATMDPQIKLFGQSISVMTSHTDAGADAEVLKPTSASPFWDTAPSSTLDGDRVLLGVENEGVVEELRSARSSSRDEFLEPPNPTELVLEYRSPNTGVPLGASDSEGAHSDELKDQGEGEHSQSVDDDKSPKPDKLVACPRCDSLDTKFCYYNNYNVNQPRHFCKNCQRYWTAGGTLRNVPVGAGRRKNKHGGLQRDCNTDASVNASIPSDSSDSASQLLSCTLGSPTSQKASSLKHSQSKRMARQGTPMRSPGSTMSFVQDSRITISTPYSLHQNGRLPFQSFSRSHGFMTSGGEMTAVVNADSASTLRQRLARFPSGDSLDKDCSRSSLSGQMQDAPNLLSMQTAFNPSILEPVSSGKYRSILPPGSSGWAGNDAQIGFHSGEWPHGYHLDLDGKHPVPSSQGVSLTTPVRNFNVGPKLPPTSSWSSTPAPWEATSWGASAGHVSTSQVSTSVWPGGQPMVPPVAVQTTLGKRVLPDSCRPEACMRPTKALRTDDCKNSSAWLILGKNQSEMNASSTTLRLFQPKLELAVACETKDSFMNRHFTAVPVARPVPFQVTI